MIVKYLTSGFALRQQAVNSIKNYANTLPSAYSWNILVYKLYSSGVLTDK